MQSLRLANMLKLNDVELSVLADMLCWSGADLNYCSDLWRSFHFDWWPSLAALLVRYC